MPFSSGEPSVSLYSSFRSCWDMLSRLDRWNSCAGMSIPAMMKSAPAMVRLATTKRLPSSASAGRMPVSPIWRSEEHTSELQSLMRISYAVFCLKKKKNHNNPKKKHQTKHDKQQNL